MNNKKPWLFEWDGIEEQDDPLYWNRDSVILSDTTKATVDQVKLNQNYGIPLVTSDGARGQFHQFFVDYQIPDNALFLEVGCGGGRICQVLDKYKEIENLDIEIYGIDHAQKAVDVARVRVPTAIFYSIGAEELPFSIYGRSEPILVNVVFTFTALQHNSGNKLPKVLDAVYKTLLPDGLLWMINELTVDSANYVPYHGIELTPWYVNHNGSHGTAARWIGLIADHGFELLSYKNSEYVFKKIG